MTPVATYPHIDTLYSRFAEGPLKGRVNVEAGFRSPDFPAVNSWRLTEKVDGQNIRVCYWPVSKERDFRGRSDNASLHPGLLGALDAMFPIDRLAEAFPPGEVHNRTEDSEWGVVVLFGEGYGPGIQKGGGRYRADKSFRLFDVLVGRWWLEWDNVAEIAAKLEIKTVPVVANGLRDLPRTAFDTKMMLSNYAQWSSVALDDIVDPPPAEAEGVVATSIPLLLRRDGTPLRWKLKFRDFPKEESCPTP